MSWCNDPWKHRDEAREDFQYRGRPDADTAREAQFGDECARVYMDEFRRLETEAYLAQRREEENAERIAYEAARERREQEEYEFYQAYEAESGDAREEAG